MRALVVAGGIPQIELIKQLKSRGIYTILVDGSNSALAIPYADKFFHEDIFDIEAIKKIALKEHVDFLITVCADQVLLVVAEVSEALGLPCYISHKVAQDVSDKIKMKRRFKEYDIPTTKFIEMKEFDEKLIEDLSFPLVVKPIDCYSSKGVRKANDLNELKKYYEEAKKISRNKDVIVEEFYQGEEISVDGFVVDGKAHVLTITKSEKIKDKDRFVIFRGKYPVDINNCVERQIENVAQKIADAFELVNSPLLIQLLTYQNKISILEFCARTGGNMKYLLIKNSCGVDVIKATIDITLGQVPDINLHRTIGKIVINDFIYCKPGIFDHFEGFSEMVARGLIKEFHPVRVKGTKMSGAFSSSDRIAGMNIIADSVEDFNQKQEIILSNTKVLDVYGNDIMNRELLPKLSN